MELHGIAQEFGCAASESPRLGVGSQERGVGRRDRGHRDAMQVSTLECPRGVGNGRASGSGE